jgi:hypothetical protein
MRILNKGPKGCLTGGCLIGKRPASGICEARNCGSLLSAAFGKVIVRIMSVCAALFLCAACVSTVPENTSSGWGNEKSSAPMNSAATSGEKAVAQDQAQPQEASPASGQATPEQATPSAGWTYAGQGYRRSCAPPIPENERLLDKIIRILSGPDWCGPDPDVDTNISAGGAAGG